MGYITRHRISMNVTTSGGAAQSFYTGSVVNGVVEAVRYLPGPTASSPSTADGISTAGHIAITADLSGIAILDATTTGSVTYYPRGAAQSATGALYGGATGAGAVVGVPVGIPVANERIKVVVTSGGAVSATAKQGTLDIYVG